MPKLTEKQSRFVRAYAQHGNATRAAEEAGYAHPNKQGPALVKLGVVSEALDKLRAKAEAKAIMSRDEALALLTAVANGAIKATELSLSGDPVDVEVAPKDRIAAVKQLARMEGWETAVKQEHSGTLTVVPATPEQAMDALRRESAKNPALAAKLKLLVGG